jgi:membrane protease subunit (stomatin/prohibitin family)
MGLWDTLSTHAKAQFLDVLQWLDDSKNTLVYRFPIHGQAIQDGGKLVVREGQAAVFLAEGRLSDVFGPGTYELSTRTKAVWGFFESIKYGLNMPYKGDVYFVSTRQYTDQKWGTANPLMLRDKDLGVVRLRAFGVFAYRVTDPAVFIRELVGTAGLYTTDEINGQLKRKLVSALADTIGESKIAALDLVSQYMDLGDALRQRLNGWFQENYGITLTDFVVENISVPPEVEKMLDKRSSMGALGDLNAYTQFQTANAIEQAASRPGGGGAFMEAGMGLAMGGAIGNQLGRAQQSTQPFNPQVGLGTPPPPPPLEARYHYHGPTAQGEYSAREIASFIQQNRAAAHNVWANGWPGWKAWSDVPEISGLLPPVPPPVPTPVTFHYAAADGTTVSASAADVAARLSADPAGRHLVWKDGFSTWKEAREVPEIASLMGGGGGPPPPPPPR